MGQSLPTSTETHADLIQRGAAAGKAVFVKNRLISRWSGHASALKLFAPLRAMFPRRRALPWSLAIVKAGMLELVKLLPHQRLRLRN